MQGASVVKFLNCRIVQDPNEAFMTLSAERPIRLPPRRTLAHSLAMVIHCAYALVLSRYGYVSDACFPSVQSGRNVSLQNASNIVGPLMTTSFLRADCSHDRTVGEMLETVSRFLLDATNHQHAAHTVVPQLFDQSIVDMGSMLVVQPRAHVSKSRSNLFSRTSAEMTQPGLILVEAIIEEETKVTLRIQYASEAMQQDNAQLLLSYLQQAIVQLAEPEMGAKQTLGSITLLWIFGNCWAVEPGNPCRLAPIGTIGELVAGGTLARGYLNRPKLTREAFFESPVWARDVCPRLYRTGDLVCQDLDGSFWYLGRADTQVKINGVRIEVAEIESRIAEIDSSVTAFVAALRSGDEEESKTLVAFISDAISQKLSIPIGTEAFQEKCASIRRELSQILPRIMVPRVWIPLASVKRTPTGKVDRKALQKVFETHKKTLSTEKPSNRHDVLTHAEKTMRSLWVSVVKCDQSIVHESTNFFDLGDSITAISLVAAAARFGYHISVGSLFKNPEPSEMALLIQDNNSTDSLRVSQDPPSFSLLTLDALYSARKDLVRDLPSHITLVDIYPVTPVQEMALVANQRWHHAYYAWFLVELTGALDPSRLQDACNQLVDVHPILGTIFFRSGATIYQAPLQNVKPDYQETPWNGDKSCVPTLIERSCSNERRSCCSPTRFRLLQHSTTHSLLAIGLSHAQYDGICLPNFFDNLITIYNGNRVARQPSFSRLIQLLNLPTQVAEAQAFWSKRLRGSSMTKLVGTLNINRPLLDSIVTNHIQLPTPSTIKRAFHAVLCLAWAITLGSATGVSDVVFGTLTSGRNASIKDISTLDGPCITTIPVRVKLDKHPPANSSADTMTLGQALEQVHTDHIETLPYEHLGLRRIVKGCTDWPSTTRFSSMVQHQNIGIWDPSSTTSAFPTRPAADGDLQWRNRGSIAYKGACDEVDLWISSLPMGENGMKVRILFSQEALPREVAESLLSILCANLKSIMRNTDQSVTTLSAMSMAQLDGVRLPIEPAHGFQGPGQNETTSCTPEAPSQTSRLLQDIWRRVLDLAPDKEFAASDSFYTQGGDSLGAAMVAGLAQAEGLSLNTQDVTECETFGAQVRRIEQDCRGVGRTNDLEWDVTDRMWGEDG